MLIVIMLSVIMLSVIMLSVIMLDVIMLSVIMLDVIMLSVSAPSAQNQRSKTYLLSPKSETTFIYASLDICRARAIKL
jgi:hypothetical protein